MLRIILLFFVILSFDMTAHAESRYVTDQVLISLRPAQNDTAPPLEYLPTGMRVELIEDLGPFLKIKSATGKIGFARSKYFIPTPPSQSIAVATGIEEQLNAALKANADLTSEIERLKTIPAKLVQTESPQKTAEAQGEIAAIRQERDLLKIEVDRLKEVRKGSPVAAVPAGSQMQWFLAGAAILLVGWFAGKSSRQKRRF